MNRPREVAATLIKLLVLWLTLGPTAQAAGPTKPTAQAQPRYAIKSGHGWAVCEAYVKSLNATPASENPPLCDMKLRSISGMTEPDWQVLDIAAHLPVVHQIELFMGVGRIEPAPLQDFELWKQQRHQRVKAQGQNPRLRSARVALAPGGSMETILSYDLDVKQCAKDVAAMKSGELYGVTLGSSIFFVLDEARQHVLSSRHWMVRGTGTLWNYQGRPHLFTPYVSGGVEPLWGKKAGVLSASLFIQRIEQAQPSEFRTLTSPNDPLYDFRELCNVEFTYPIARLHN